MRVMVQIKANADTESGKGPDEKILTAMGNFNEELVKAGVMLGGEGLHPSSSGKRVRLEGGKATVVDGPFAETKELIAGFWIWKVKSMDEALAWVKRIPTDGAETVIELRRLYESEDFGDEFTPEARAQEDRLRAEIAGKS